MALVPTKTAQPLRSVDLTPPNIARYINRTIFVSIPALFEDGVSRPYRLLGAEMNGLWLQSEELTRRLLPDERQDLASSVPMVFVPFAQIAGVLITTAAPMSSSPALEEETATEADAPAAGGSKANLGNAGDTKPKRKTKKD